MTHGTGDNASAQSVMSAAKKLEDRAFATYKCRLVAFGRLDWLNRLTNNLLVAFSTSTTIASVGMLVDRDMYGGGGDALMVALAILSLVAALVVASSNYGTRAKAMEANYKEIQRLSTEAENISLGAVPDSEVATEFFRIQSEYHRVINTSENHTDRDHKLMKRGKQPGNSTAYVLFVLPVLLLIPFIAWYVNAWATVKPGS